MSFFNVSTNFTRDEFACPCCGVNLIEDRVIVALQAVRERIKFPMMVNSGYRCEKHNATLPDSAPDSYHVKGLAVDIQVTPYLLHKILEVAPLFFYGIGLYHDKNIIHLDMRPESFKAVWVK